MGAVECITTLLFKHNLAFFVSCHPPAGAESVQVLPRNQLARVVLAGLAIESEAELGLRAALHADIV